MKIQELKLVAVGPFTDLTLDLSGGTQGLHLIYGPNEAGKSSTLRAIRYLLYGFPMRLSDDFVHSYQKLRVGGRLISDRRQELLITRRKAKQKSLRDGHDEHEIGEDQLRAFLGNASEDLFSRAFGIDHQTLVRGGEEIVRGEGDLGQMLFTGSGVVHLRDVGMQLDSELAALFSSRAQKPVINGQLREFKDARKRVRDNQLRPAEWERHYTALQDARKRQRRVEAERDDSRRRRDRLARFQSALVPISELLDLQDQALELHDVISLPAEFNTQRETAMRDLSIAQSKRETATREIEHRNEQLARITLSQELLDNGPRMESLEKNLHRFQDSQTDRSAVVVALKSLETEALSVLRELGEDTQLDQATSLLLPATERARIQRLVADYGKVAEAVEGGARKSAELDADLSLRQQELSDSPQPPDPRNLKQELADALKLGDIEPQLVDLQTTIASESEETARELARLQGWSGSLEELEVLRVPGLETVERFADEIREAQNVLDKIEEQIRQTQQGIEAHQTNLDQLSADHDVPTEVQLTKLRARRDHAWRLIRGASRDIEASNAEVTEFLDAEGFSDRPLEDSYEDLVSSADTISDRLRHEADRVARHRNLQTELARTHRHMSELLGERDRCTECHQQVVAKWQDLWQAVGIEPLSPREMRSWIQRLDTLLNRARSLRDVRRQEAEMAKRLAVGRQRMAEELAAAGQAVEPAEMSLDELRRNGHDTLDELHNLANQRREIEHEIERLEKARQRTRLDISSAKKQLSDWRREWESAVSKLPPVVADQPAEANQVLELLHQLSLKLSNADQERGRLAEIDAFSSQFDQQVRELAQYVTPELDQDPSLERIATDILARYRRAMEQDRERKRIKGELEKCRLGLETATGSVGELQMQLDQLCQMAKCQSSDELLAAWDHSERKHRVQQRIEQLRSELRQLAAAMTLDEFISAARSQEADELPAQLEQLDREIAEMDRFLIDDIGPTIGREEETLNRMDSSGHAAAAEEEAQDILASLSQSANEYAVLCVAQVALRRAIERYRNRHQDPILHTASDVFARLTVGSFQGLKVDYDSSGDPTLVGVRSDTADAVPVSRMSDGTADQLYFALRYSWLTHYLENHESLPFIVDDILIRFDDDRASETLKVLGELSARTQVLFFTHHRRLLDLAHNTLPDDVLFTHELA